MTFSVLSFRPISIVLIDWISISWRQPLYRCMEILRCI